MIGAPEEWQRTHANGWVAVVSVDTDGNVYVTEVDNGGAQKYRPRKGANPAMLLGKPLRVAWK